MSESALSPDSTLLRVEIARFTSATRTLADIVTVALILSPLVCAQTQKRGWVLPTTLSLGARTFLPPTF